MAEPRRPVEQQVAVVAVPFPAQGHLNQLLHFSLLISSHDLPVHFACSATHNRQAKERIHGWAAEALQSIRFHDLPLPPFSAPPHDRNSAINFPTQLQPVFEASAHLQGPLAALLRSLSATTRRLVVVHDPLMSFASREAASFPNAESYRFQCIPAVIQLSYLWEYTGKRTELQSGFLDVLLSSNEGCFTEEFLEFVTSKDYATPAEAGILANTSRAFEGNFIELLTQEPGYNKFFAIGPVNPVVFPETAGPRHAYLEWLDKQPPASVVYVAFGSTAMISDGQIEQLAEGLRRSEQRFIWVLKDADRGDIYIDNEEGSLRKLLPNYDKEVEGVGIVIRGWAPQLEILAHPSTGAFMSHCGWNSCMESLSMGVPIMAWPMHSDQPRNALMMTEYLKVGVPVRDWARRNEVLSSSEIKKVIEMLMVHDEGKEIRRRAKELGEALRRATMKDGLSKADLDSFITQITR